MITVAVQVMGVSVDRYNFTKNEYWQFALLFQIMSQYEAPLVCEWHALGTLS